MKKFVLASISALLVYSLLFSVHTASAALVVDQAATPWTWTANQGDTILISDSGEPIIQGTDISGYERFGLYQLGSDLSTAEKLVLLNDTIDSGTLTFSSDGTQAVYTLNSGEQSTLNLTNASSDPEWGFYFFDGSKYLSYSITGTGPFELAADNMLATVSAVPIPGAGLLLTTGLIGLAGIRTRFGKK